MKEIEANIISKAIYSDNKKYRYSLIKTWDTNKDKAFFIGINPSDATELIMDKTVMNLTNHLIINGFGEVEILNLFAYRSKKQSKLKQREEKYEKLNIEYIKKVLDDKKLIIVGWGRDAESKSQYQTTILKIKNELKKYRDIKCFEDNKQNFNCHLSVGYSDKWKLVEYL